MPRNADGDRLASAFRAAQAPTNLWPTRQPVIRDFAPVSALPAFDVSDVVAGGRHGAKRRARS